MAYDPPWLKSVGDLATTGIGLAAAILIWQVFPSTWPLTPAVTSSTDRRQLTETFSPVNATFAALLGLPGQIRYATLALGCDLSSGRVHRWRRPG